MKAKNKIAVIFRTWVKTGEVIAIFPFEPHDRNGWLCVSYSKQGEHSAADPNICRMPHTRRATPSEICDLACTLRARGYTNIKGLRRVPRNAFEVRKQKAQA